MKQYLIRASYIKCFGVWLICICTFITNAQEKKPTVTTYTSKVKLSGNSYTIDDMISMDYGVLYHLNYDKEEGIQGTMSKSGDSIVVRVFDYVAANTGGKGVEVYQVFLDETTSAGVYKKKVLASDVIVQIDGEWNIRTKSNDIKKRAQDAQVYSPGSCDQSWTDLFKIVVNQDASGCNHTTVPVQPVIVEVKIIGEATFTKAKIPGIGVVTVQNGKVVLSPPGDFYNYCTTNSNSPLCTLFNNIRTPNTANTEDIFIAAHRGWWGYNLGTGVPENTLAAVQQANSQNAKIVEMDLTVSADNQLVFMHDYVMKRLTDYTGDKFSFDLIWSVMNDYNVRKRDGTVSNGTTLSRFFEVLEYVKDNNMILMVDVKEQQSNGKAPNCLANCDFQTLEKQKASWAKIVRQCIRQAESIEGKKNLIFKTYYPPKEVYKLIGNQMFSVLWTPMLVPNNFKNSSGNPDINLMTSFVDAWDTDKYKNTIACYETNFFSPTDVMLQSFSKNNTTYSNLLHYIHATTGRRSGIFSEEPVSPKGTVNRWGKWKIKNPSQDIRGDFFRLITIPYGKYMLVTTDRLDVWKEIKTKF